MLHQTSLLRMFDAINLSGAHNMDHLISRPYRHDDFDACLSIFDSNVPGFFSIAERGEFEAFLGEVDADSSPYIVLALEGSVVACGGLSLDADKGVASLSWGMVDQAYHGKGLGTRLTEERLKLARSSMQIAELVLATSQHTFGFYRRHGFTVVQVTPDGFAAGMDRYDMKLRIA
ncbi:MAG: GNAT family N-acetyltransferase [Rhizobium rosettiformans]